MAELVYAADSKSAAARLEGSSPSPGTAIIKTLDGGATAAHSTVNRRVVGSNPTRPVLL